MLDEAERERVRQMVKENEDATLAQLSQIIKKKLKKRVSPSALCRLWQGLGLPRKKSRFTPRSGTPGGYSKPEPSTSR